MYPNLRAEMARKGLTLGALAKYLGVCPSTLSMKYNGRREWSFTEVQKVKSFIGTEMPLEELFEEEK